MENEFNQHRLFYSRRFILKHDGIHVKFKKLFKQHEYELNYEEIGSKVINTKEGKKGWLTASIILIAIAVILLIDRLSGGDVEKGAEILYGFSGLVCGLLYIVTFTNSIYLVKSNNKNAIEFLKNNPSKEQLEEFIATIKSKRKEYLIDRYGSIRKNLGYHQQYNDLSWLYDNDVINEAEYQEKLKELELVILKPVTVVGFKSAFNK